MDDDAAALDDLLELGDDFEAFAEQLAADENYAGDAIGVAGSAQAAGQLLAESSAQATPALSSSSNRPGAGLNDQVNVNSLFDSGRLVGSGTVKTDRPHPSIANAVRYAPTSDDDNTEEYSKLRIANRLVPKLELRHALAGRRVVRVQDLETVAQQRQSAASNSSWAERAYAAPDIGGKRKDTLDDVYCIGVLGDKSLPKSTAGGGGKYMSWTITDYKASVTVLLFGEAYSTHWQAELGSIFLIAQPDVLRADDHRKVSFSVKKGLQVLKIGTSPVLGRCKGRKKDGGQCTMPVDTSGTGVCKYHAEKAYKDALDDRGQFRSQPLPLAVNGLLPAMSNRNVSAGSYGLQTAGYINSMAQRAGVPLAAVARDGATGVHINKLSAVALRPTAPNGAVSTVDGYAMHSAEGAIGARGSTHAVAGRGGGDHLRSAASVAGVTISARGEVQELCAADVHASKATSTTGREAMKVKGVRRDEGTLVETAKPAESAAFKSVATRVLASALVQPSHNGSAGAKHLAAMAGLSGVRDISKPASHQDALIGMTQAIYGSGSSSAAGGKGKGSSGMDAGLSAAVAKAQARRKQAWVVEMPPEPGQAPVQPLKEAAYVGGRSSSQSSMPAAPVSRPSTVGLPISLSLKMKDVKSVTLGTAGPRPPAFGTGGGQQGPSQPLKRPRDEDNLRVVSYNAAPKEAGADPLGAVTGGTADSGVGTLPLLPILPLQQRKKAKLEGAASAVQSSQLLAMEEEEAQDDAPTGSALSAPPSAGGPSSPSSKKGSKMVDLDDEAEEDDTPGDAPHQGLVHYPPRSDSATPGPAAAPAPFPPPNAHPLGNTPRLEQPKTAPNKAGGPMAPPAVPSSYSSSNSHLQAPRSTFVPPSASAPVSSGHGHVHIPVPPHTRPSAPFHAATARVAITNPAELDKLRASQASDVAKAKMRLLRDAGIAVPSPATALMHSTASSTGKGKGVPITAAKAPAAGKAGAGQGKGKLGVSLDSAAALLAASHSRHEADAEEEKVEALFKKMEGRERTEELEAQLREVTSKKVTRWMCHDCDKVYEKPPAMCTTEGHALDKIERVEHAFKCNGCGEKIMHAQASCAKACPKCSGRSWAKTSVHKLKEWSDKPALEGMELKTRGEEQVNSLRYG